MTKKQEWKRSDIRKTIKLERDILEFQDIHGEWQVFHVIATPERVVFGGCANVGFIESGYIERDLDAGESLDETLGEMLADLETYYNDGPQYVTRIIVNKRM